jgi:high-affinity iron transporter
MLWGWVGNLVALGGALLGIAASVLIGYGLYRGAIRIDIGTFFTWSSVFLLVIAAGILAYGIHDLQEAAVLPGPFSGAPISPTHPRTGEVLTGFADYPFWGAAYPFGWAFNLENVIEPTGFLAALLKGTVGFAPMMTWLEVTVWAVYLIAVFPAFIRRARRLRRPAPRPAAVTASPGSPATVSAGAQAPAPTAAPTPAQSPAPAGTPAPAAATEPPEGDGAAVVPNDPSPLSAKGTR